MPACGFVLMPGDFSTTSWCAFAAKVPESARMDFALKMHKGFSFQSVGQSTAAATIFNDAYRETQARLKEIEAAAKEEEY